MILTADLKSLKECPDCKASWVEVKDSLFQDPESENYRIARFIIECCPTGKCKERFEDFIR